MLKTPAILVPFNSCHCLNMLFDRHLILKKQVASNKSRLLLNISLQNTYTLQKIKIEKLFTKVIKRPRRPRLGLDRQSQI